MKTVIIYASTYGSTKTYASKLQQQLNCDIYQANNFNKNDFNKYDTIIFGGSIIAGKIKNFKLIKNNFEDIKEKQLYVFYVSLSKDTNQQIEILNANFTDEMKSKISVSAFGGKYDYNSLSFIHKLIMKLPIADAKKKYKENPSEENERKLRGLQTQIDLIDDKDVDDLVKKIKNNS